MHCVYEPHSCLPVVSVERPVGAEAGHLKTLAPSFPAAPGPAAHGLFLWLRRVGLLSGRGAWASHRGRFLLASTGSRAFRPQ